VVGIGGWFMTFNELSDHDLVKNKKAGYGQLFVQFIEFKKNRLFRPHFIVKFSRAIRETLIVCGDISEM